MSTAGSSRRTGRVATPLAAAVLLAIALLATPVTLFAHAHLTKSAPSSGARLTSSPTAVALWFSEAPELAFTRITLLGPDSVPVALGEVQPRPREPLAVSAAIRSPLAAGEYTVIWQTAAADGHPSRGRFTFVMLPSSATAAMAESLGASSHVQMMQRHAEGQPHPMGGAPGEDLGAESCAYVAVRWLSFAALLTLVGVTAFRWLVLPRAARLAERHARGPVLCAVFAPLASRAARAGAIAAGVLLLAAAARLYVQSVAMHGVGAIDVAMMRQMATHTRWGSAWLVQVVATATALLGMTAAFRVINAGTRRSHAAWMVATVAVLVLAVTPALGGHAAATPRLTALAIALDGLHVLGAGGWLGALLIVLTVGLPAVLAGELTDRGGAVADLVNAFSPTALGFTTLVVLTGLFAAWLHVGTFAALWGSPYGRTLLLKLGLLIPVLGTGAYNWLRVRPALAERRAGECDAAGAARGGHARHGAEDRGGGALTGARPGRSCLP